MLIKVLQAEALAEEARPRRAPRRAHPARGAEAEAGGGVLRALRAPPHPLARGQGLLELAKLG